MSLFHKFTLERSFIISIQNQIRTDITSFARHTCENYLRDTYDTVLSNVSSFLRAQFGYQLTIDSTTARHKFIHFIKKTYPKKYAQYVQEATSDSPDFYRASSFLVKLPKCNAFLSVRSTRVSEIELFMFGPDAKRAMELMTNYFSSSFSITSLFNPLRCYNVDLNQKGDPEISSGSKLPAKPFDNIYTDPQKKSHVVTYVNNWKNAQSVFRGFDISYKLGILLYGPPGTGKTTMAKAIASALNRDIYSVNLEHFGPSIIKELNNRNMMDKGIVVLLEDIDYIFGSRQTEVSTSDRSRSNTLLQFLDGANSLQNVVIIATTNDISSLDPAIIRDGRFDLKIEMNNISRDIAKEMCTGMKLSDEQTEIVLSDESFPINPAYLQNKILQYVFSHIGELNLNSGASLGEEEEEEFEW